MIPVVLSGGSGTRLWPISRESYPKQFCEFYDQSFLANTLQRLTTVGSPRVLTIQNMEALTYRTFKEVGLPTDQIYYEPYGKNTAPAIAFMVHHLSQLGFRDEVVGFFPADHLIFNTRAFHNALKVGEACAENGEVVTLGVQPNYPATGYGYIQIGEKKTGGSVGPFAHRALKFCEKPSLEKAKEFLANGNYFWNAGIFIFKVSVMAQLFSELAPDLWKKITKIDVDLKNAKYQYANLESESFDYLIMEKLKSTTCIPCDMGWSDVGSWDEISRLSEEMGEVQSGSHALVFNENSHSNFVFSLSNKVFGFIDVNDLIVVDTPDAVLISKKGSTQKVKFLVDEIKKQGVRAASEHPFEKRHWGGYEVLSNESSYKVKRITIDPGARLSYQSHTQRQEHWVVIDGLAEVVIDEEIKTLRPGESVMVPIGVKHRMKNISDKPLIFVEVQTGTYFGEDDIVRYADDYDRI